MSSNQPGVGRISGTQGGGRPTPQGRPINGGQTQHGITNRPTNAQATSISSGGTGGTFLMNQGIGSGFGYGLGTGLGFGLGSNLGYGMFGPGGYGGFGGYGGYGGGYGGNGGYGSYGGNGYANPGVNNAYYPPSATGGQLNGASVQNTAGAGPSAVNANLKKGEADFANRNYRVAVSDLRQAVADQPSDGITSALFAQALFATGQFREATDETRRSMGLLNPENWGVVPTNLGDLYSNLQDYADQFQALERATENNPNSSDLQFLLGFHAGYRGNPNRAVACLDKALQLVPQDTLAQRLRYTMLAKKG